MAAGQLAALVAGHAVLGAALLATVEKFLPVVPSSALLVCFGMTMVTGPGDLATLLLATTTGSTVGCLCLYAAGRMLGEGHCAALVSRYGRYVHISDTRYRRWVTHYRRHEFRMTLLGQTIPAARACLPLPAGIFRMAIGRFVLAVVMGATIWNGSFLTIGFILRPSG